MIGNASWLSVTLTRARKPRQFESNSTINEARHFESSLTTDEVVEFDMAVKDCLQGQTSQGTNTQTTRLNAETESLVKKTKTVGL